MNTREIRNRDKNMTETIQEIYEKAHKEEYDNILVRDMEYRIQDNIHKMVQKYLENIGLKHDEENEIYYRGEIVVSEYDAENETDIKVKYKIGLRLEYPSVVIDSDNPEFGSD